MFDLRWRRQACEATHAQALAYVKDQASVLLVQLHSPWDWDNAKELGDRWRR